ncbi:DUF4843 domain-containing protein [Niastella populi]|uniref:DUF4843 domain-containing protein n=1 Tax=Niastella populi TaxID=550983 RepID=A0A1V9F0Y1_9BACT|nr:DUF4843 domain-containing protein [Niastella populi]OQP51916.1 hypothetical protein A4R26_29295 [Niastella populi]
MKKLISHLFIAAGALLLFSCEKKLATYSGENNIYFSNTSDSAKITFAYDKEDKKDSTVLVRVYTTGPLADVDRPFELTIIDSITNAQAGVHYTLLNNELVVKAGQPFVNLAFKLNRLPEMITTTYYINMVLEPNDNFTTNYTWEWVNLKNSTVKQLMRYTIRFDDVLAQPKTWLSSSFGTFSRKKLIALSEFFEIELPVWNITGAGGISAVMMITYGKVFQRYLNDEAANGNIILDEDGTPMKMGPGSQ